MDVKELRQEVDRRTGQRDQALTQVNRIESRMVKIVEEKESIKEAQQILQVVAQKTQQELEYHISELVSLALLTVFPDPYKLNLDFVLKNDKSAAILSFSKKDGEKINPMDASGGGAVDVAALALRVSLWSLRNPRTRPVIIMDEPARFVSRNLQEKLSNMIKEISERLGIQFIIVTHEPTLAEAADRVFEVSMENRRSSIEIREEE